MSLEIGSVVSGKVAKITKFGAFIKLSNGKTGLCHISEISSNFIKEISDVLEVDQQVEVKVLSIKDDGKVALSVKQASNNQSVNTKKSSAAPVEHSLFTDITNRGNDFEDMLSGYLKNSSDKLKNMKKQRSRRGNGFNR